MADPQDSTPEAPDPFIHLLRRDQRPPHNCQGVVDWLLSGTCWDIGFLWSGSFWYVPIPLPPAPDPLYPPGISPPITPPTPSLQLSPWTSEQDIFESDESDESDIFESDEDEDESVTYTIKKLFQWTQGSLISLPIDIPLHPSPSKSLCIYIAEIDPHS